MFGIFVILVILFCLALFLYYDKKAQESWVRQKELERESIKWFNELSRDYPDCYEAIVGKKENLH